MDALEQYIHDHTSPEEELLHELDRATNLRVVQPRVLSGHIQGRLLEMLVRMLRPQRILEIGTFTGYSALSMAAGLEEGGELHTIEVEDELEEISVRTDCRRSGRGCPLRPLPRPPRQGAGRSGDADVHGRRPLPRPAAAG